jgi:class 3 adenylate cyclase
MNIGWAIEGATGSNFKIDISYYSNAIRLAKQLEDLNKYYQKNFLVISDVYEYMSKGSKNYFRMIDSLKFDDNISKSN